jgi:integrase
MMSATATAAGEDLDTSPKRPKRPPVKAPRRRKVRLPDGTMVRVLDRAARGAGTVFQRGGRGAWSIRWSEGGRYRYESGIGTEDEARRLLAKIVVNVKEGRVGIVAKPTTGAPTLSELFIPWLKERETTKRAWKDDRSRWNKHLGPYFGKMRPAEVTKETVRAFVLQKLSEGLKTTSVGHLVRLLSVFFARLSEQIDGLVNPVLTLPKGTRTLYRTAETEIPYLSRPEDITRLFLSLPEGTNVAFAIGAMAGLRTGEVLAIAWEDIDLGRRRIRVSMQVQDGRLTTTKGKKARTVPIPDALGTVLTEWRLKTGGVGLLFRPKHPTRGGRPGRPAEFVRPNTLNLHLADAIADCPGVPAVSWYGATRHTFASLYVTHGGTLERLRVILGHRDIQTTQRYSHLAPDSFPEADYSRLPVNLSRPAAKVLSLSLDVASSCAGVASGDSGLQFDQSEVNATIQNQ